MAITREDAYNALAQLAEQKGMDGVKPLLAVLEYLVDGASHAQTNAEHLIANRVRDDKEKFFEAMPQTPPENPNNVGIVDNNAVQQLRVELEALRKQVALADQAKANSSPVETPVPPSLPVVSQPPVSPIPTPVEAAAVDSPPPPPPPPPPPETVG